MLNSTFIFNLFRYRYSLTLLLLIFSCGACSPDYLQHIERGNGYSHEVGTPSINLITSSHINEENNTQAIVLVSIIESSLIYKFDRDSLRSNGELIIEVLNADDSEIHAKKTVPLTLVKEVSEDYYNQNELIIEETLDVKPGDLEVKVTARDFNSGKETTSAKPLTVPNPEKEVAFHSNILLYAKNINDRSYTAINNYDIQSKFDSLKFVFQVTHSQNSAPLNIKTDLVKFRADTTIARRMSDRNYRPSSLQHEGLDYSKSEVIQTNHRTISTEGSVTIEYIYTDLPPGNYRFESTSQTNGDQNYRARDFAIKTRNYPSLKNAFELAQPLAYLMREGSYEKLISITSKDSLKATIDQYWLNNVQNTSKAKNILELFYERVEQANRQFSNFKEGWKTDPGMIYILFGPPLYVEEGFGEMTWYYDFDSGNRTPSIYFEDVQYGNKIFPFENYVLRRSPDLFNLEYRQIQAWNDGSILFLNQ